MVVKLSYIVDFMTFINKKIKRIFDYLYTSKIFINLHVRDFFYRK